MAGPRRAISNGMSHLHACRPIALLLAALTFAGCSAALPGGVARSGAATTASGKLKKPTTTVNPTVAKTVEMVFRVLDRNADGAIDALEWPFDADLIARGAPALALADADEGKKVEPAEWAAFATPRFTGPAFALVDLPAGLAKADKDGDGKLTPDETTAFFKALTAATRESLYLDTQPAAKWVEQADKNKDFALDKGELEHLLTGLIVRRMGDLS